MLPLLLAPAFLQMLAMSFDELHYHRARGLPRWERIGHPLDTVSAAVCYGWLVLMRPSAPHALGIYLALTTFSCLFITKDESVHAAYCEPGEQWLHSLLFVLHPVVFAGFGFIWWLGLAPWVLELELALTLGFGVYQVLYWSVSWPRISAKRSR